MAPGWTGTGWTFTAVSHLKTFMLAWIFGSSAVPSHSVLVTLCVPEDEGPATEILQRSQPDVRRIHWSDGGIEFHPSHGELIEILSRHGFRVERLRELYAPPGAQEHSYYQIAVPQWGERWPVEDLWEATLRG